jgi:hypothetical protein
MEKQSSISVPSIDNLDEKKLSINNKNLEQKNKLDELNILLNQNLINLNKFELSFGLEHNYEFYQINNKYPDEISQKDLILLNVYNFIKKLDEYLKKTTTTDSDIEIEITFNTPTENEYKLFEKIKQVKKYDALIKIFSNKNFKSYEIGLDYSELAKYELDDKSYEQRYFDDISSSVNTDNYYRFCTKESELDKFVERFVFETLIILYSYLDDEYGLSKIIYHYSNKTSKNIKKDSQFFNKVINYMKEGTFDLEKFFEKLMFINNDGETIGYDEFVSYLKDELNIELEFEPNTTLCKIEYFEQVINGLENKNSPLINIYRKIYARCLESLRQASKEIIRLTNKNNGTKDNFSEYVRINFK